MLCLRGYVQTCIHTQAIHTYCEEAMQNDRSYQNGSLLLHVIVLTLDTGRIEHTQKQNTHSYIRV